jgi:DNA-binding FadR family transcriptional regulator
MTARTQAGAFSVVPIVTTSAASQIADTIEQMILDGRLRVDDRLPSEGDLAARFGVSRPTVREGLKRLAARNLIRSRRGSSGGNFVSGASPDELAVTVGTAAALMVATSQVSLDEIATARAEMEAVCCRLAAANRTDEHIAAMRAEVDLQRGSGMTDEEFCASDVRFHRVIVDAAGNALLRFLMSAVVETLLPVSNMIIVRVRDRRTIAGYHKRIVDALERRHAEPAVEAVQDLIAYTRDRHSAADGARRERARSRSVTPERRVAAERHS